MFTFFTDSRSAWKKSCDRAIELVLAGKMTELEFAAVALASPDQRDPLPATKLASALAAQAEAKDRAGTYAREAAEKDAALAAEIERTRNHRCWRLGGFYIEDQSTARYTLAEIERWVDWDAYNLRHNHPSVTAVSDSGLTLDLSGRFANPCGDKCRTPSFEKLAIRLRDYIADRLADMAGNN